MALAGVFIAYAAINNIAKACIQFLIYLIAEPAQNARSKPS